MYSWDGRQETNLVGPYSVRDLYQMCIRDRDCGDWLNWTVPDTDCNLPIFASGWGDGYYHVYFGYRCV